MSAGIVLSATGLCLAGSLLPWISRELVVGGAAAVVDRAWLPALVISTTLAQMAGKAGLYALARWAPDRLPRRARRILETTRSLSLSRSRGAVLVILTSSAVGLPPFYLTALAAGAMNTPFALFVGAGGVGTLARTAAVAWVGHRAVAATPLAAQESTGAPGTLARRSAYEGLRIPTLVDAWAACREGRESDAVVERVAEALSDLDVRGPARLAQVLDSLERNLGPNDPRAVDDRFRRAVILGARIETLEGRDRVRAAQTLYDRVSAILDLDPDHSGANHLMGRLHAAVMRVGGTTRFLARIMVGGELLSSASWQTAVEHLRAAETGAPCLPEHHLELARALDRMDRHADAQTEIAHVLALTSMPHAGRHAAARSDALRARAVALAGGGC